LGRELFGLPHRRTVDSLIACAGADFFDSAADRPEKTLDGAPVISTSRISPGASFSLPQGHSYAGPSQMTAATQSSTKKDLAVRLAVPHGFL